MKLDVRINHFHAAFAILAVTIGTVFFPVAGVVVPLAGAAGWVSVLLAFVVALPWVFMAMGLVSRGPLGDFGQAVRAWLGPWLGGLLVGQSGMVTQAVALPDTPQMVLNAALLFLVVLTDLRGFEVFIRTLELLMLVVMPIVAVYILIAARVVKIENLQPLFGEPPILIAHAAYLALPWVDAGHSHRVLSSWPRGAPLSGVGHLLVC